MEARSSLQILKSSCHETTPERE